MRTRIYRTAALALSALLTASLATACQKAETEDTSGDDEAPLIGYADSAMIVDDATALKQAIDEAAEKAKEPGVGIHYKPTAHSTNGIDFACDIGNPESAAYDEFITIFGDEAFNDELYQSQLLRPGYALDSITLNHPLEPGSHTVYVRFTQVATEDGKQVFKKEATISMDFVVDQ